MNHDSPAEIRAELASRGLTLKKRWGQNFLINRGARETIVRLLDPRPGQGVWEIGPGLGAMTELVLERGGRCVVFEIDRGLCRYLEETFGGRNGFFLVAGDFVKTWREAVGAMGAPDLLLGNLPYRSASLMVADIVEGGLRPRRAVLAVQREAADRMCSLPGVKSYSSFSVLCQAAFTVRARGDFSPGSFYPAPEVTSTVVELVPRDDAPMGSALEILGILSRCLFAARRKTIRNNLAAARLPAGASRQEAMDELKRAGADPAMRAEELSPETYVRAAKALASREWIRGPSDL
ncbi:MAG TPA: 16S rRNA (adenine(1518)-N(6)/adenine(1519)-N(6))-dimethyltransferase RsmA [Spirochaetia bacterium]|nr:16S rRNA (adenine(1518)-N(6)/adenine(1519)-N(6))-dimethyltransferase RsmA [Spirochaetia bacterium]